MTEEEADWTIAQLRAEIEELHDRVASLEMRAGRHNCLIDCCDFGRDGECVLKARVS